MKSNILGLLIGLGLGFGVGLLKLPIPAPPSIWGALTVVAVTVGYLLAVWVLR